MSHFIIISTILLCSNLSAEAQGLKGLPIADYFCKRPNFIAGKTVKERWKTFSNIQPNLIGMKFEQVKKLLGPTIGDDVISTYSINGLLTQSNKEHQIQLRITIFFHNGIAYKYIIEPDN